MLAALGKRLAPLLGEERDFKVSSPLLEATNDFMATHSLGDLLPYLSYDPNQQIFYNKSSVGFTLETVPLVGSGEDIQRQLTGIFQHTLPEGSNLQFLLIASSRIEDWLTGWHNPRAEDEGILKALATGRVEFFRKLALATNINSPYRLRTYKLIVSYSQEGSTLNPHELHKLHNLKQQIITTFKGFGLPIKIWSATDLLRGLDEILNMSERLDSPSLEWNQLQDISSQVMASGSQLLVNQHGLLQRGGEYGMRCYSVRSYPSQWYLGGMSNFIGDPMNDLMQIPCAFMLHYGVHICGEKTLKSRVLGKCSQVEHQANSPVAKWVPSLKKEADEWGFVRQQFEEGQRLVRTRYQVVLMDKDEQLSNAEQLLFNLYRANRWDLICDQFIHLPSLISCLPMSWGEGIAEDSKRMQKTKTTLSHEPANLLPIQGEWQGTKTPGLLLSGRRGQIFYWNAFDNEAGNYNTCVVGRSGAGKSVFMQELITSMLGLGGRVFVLDVGRSFEKTVKLLDGQFIEFSTQSLICINPFSTIPVDNQEATSDALAMLKPIISLMAAPNEGTDDLENALIEKALHIAWEKKKNEATITDVAEALLNNKSKKAQELGQMLYPYTADGNYGRFFTGPANINLTDKLIVVELEELKERKDLQAVIVQMVILQITNQVYLGDRKTPSCLVLDEAWDMLRGKQSGEFIETAARRLRKYYGGLVVGTQSVNDFYASPGAQAAFDNSDWMCLLSQKKESIEQLKKSNRLSMDPGMESMLRSVHTKQGEYAEVMISGPNGYSIGRLLLDPFSKVLYSTKAEEYSAVKNLEQQGLTLAEAIQKVAKEKYHE